jgi:hypothetical protein
LIKDLHRLTLNLEPETCCPRAYPGRPLATNCIARWKIGNIGNIVVHQQLSRQQIGNKSATSATFLEPFS